MKLVVDMHVHTIVSGHAYSTIQETAAAAKEKGLEMIAFTEHGPAMEGAPLPIYFLNMLVLPHSIFGVKILRGAEVNVVDYKGKVDLDDRVLQRLDFVIAGLHEVTLPVSDVIVNTDAMVGAIANPLVDAISHPGNYHTIDIPEVVKAAKKYGKLLELNNNYINTYTHENYYKIAELCAEANIPVMCGSDCHVSSRVGDFEKVLALLEEVRFPEELILNASSEAMMAHLNKSRKRERGI